MKEYESFKLARKFDTTNIKPKNLHEGKGVVYSLVSESLDNLQRALKMARKNKKMRGMIPGLSAAIKAIERIE